MNSKAKFGIPATIIAFVIIISFVGYDHTAFASSTNVLRIGYYPNLTHAPAVIGIDNGDFQKNLGDVNIQTQVFNAGPAEIEALFANQIDVAYVGPGPTINGYVKSDGDLRVISGVASGGAVFVVRNDAGIQSVQDFVGKKFSSPQLGNTQDIALRIYLLNNGYKTTDNGGSVTIMPASNPDIVTLFLKKSIDGAWVPEPWGAKLVKEANGKILVDERDLWPNGKFVTTNIVVRTEYLNEHPDVIKKLLEANVDEISWINKNPDQARQAFNSALDKLTGKTTPDNELKDAFSRVDLTYDPVASSLYKTADNTYQVGFLDSKPDLSNIYDLTLLNQVLAEKGLQPVSSNANAQLQSVVNATTNAVTSSPAAITNNSAASPEFGPVAALVLVIATVSVVAVTAKTRVIPKL